MNEHDNLELYEMREHEILEELGRTGMTDPNRKKLEDALSTISSIRVSYEQTEQTRLNNNAKNDIEEAKLVIEQEKVKNDKTRNRIFVIQALLSFFGGSYLINKSYHMDEKGYPYKDMKKRGQDLINRMFGK